MRRLGAVVAAAAVLVVPFAPAAGAADPTKSVSYQPPVDAPVLEPFAPPASKYGAGNRGVDYESEPGTVVTAAADGEVVFAGRIGASHHVTVLHADGIRTSYSFLAAVAVRRGDSVVAGQPIGTTEGALHFGARSGDEYVDPLLLLGGEKPKVRLVPDDLRRPLGEAEERSRLAEALRGIKRRVLEPAAAAIAKMKDAATDEIKARFDELMLAVHYTRDVVAMPTELVEAVQRWRDEQGRCTPAQERAPPPPKSARRIVVLVGGLGSTSDKAAVFRTDVTALGYRPDDVHRFSYRGVGQPYEAHDTTQDIAVSAERLREHVDDLRRRHPGVQIDVIAHSQGGLVARRAAVDGMQGVSNIVTLGTPHHGADLATAAALIAHSETGEDLLRGGGLIAAGIDPTATSIAQMGEHSTFIRDLNSRPIPPSVRFRSIAARGDWAVPSQRSRVPGGADTNATVEVDGVVNDHDQLPGSAAATREIALALGGRPPTCRGLPDHVLDVITSETIARVEDAAALGLGYAAHRADGARPKRPPVRLG
jgi:pimeloyl-ACP methyl ester carboxylesterase